MMERWRNWIGRYRAGRTADDEYRSALEASARGDYAEAVRAFKGVIRSHPDDVRAHRGLGEALQDAGEWSESAAAYRQAIQLEPTSTEAHYGLAVAHSQLGDWDRAIPHLREVIRLDPLLARAHCDLGTALRGPGQYEQALRHHEEAVRLDPRDPAAHAELGQTLGEMGRWTEAIRHYEESVRLGADFPEVFAHLGMALTETGRTAEAAKAFEQAIQKGHSNLADMQSRLGWCLVELKRSKEAVAVLRSAYAADPTDLYTLGELARALVESGESDEGLALLQSAIQRHPDSPSLRIRLGEAYSLLKDWRKAESACREAIELGGGGEGYFLLSTIFADSGRCPEALEAFRHAEELDPVFLKRHPKLKGVLRECGEEAASSQ